MTYRVIVADRVAQELEATARWWGDHHSPEQAERWYSGFIVAIDSLQFEPERYPHAREEVRFAVELRQLNYGLGKHPTHRAVFTIQGSDVTFLAMRHLAQRELTQDDLR
jgi:plasmid stabilization system protein ParE